MNKDQYFTLLKMHRHHTSNWWRGALTLAWVSAWTMIGIYLSLQSGLWWWLGQGLLGVTLFQWFVLVHDFGHGCFFKSRKANWIFGHLASLFPILPFTPWKAIHSRHHTWTGWHDRDPTMEQTQPHNIGQRRRALANVVWKYWLPVLSLAFSFKNFWNWPRLNHHFNDSRRSWQFIFSMLLLVAVYIPLMIFMPQFWHVWPVAYLIFLVISDPMLISQHSHIPQEWTNGEKVKPFAVYEQDVYTRSLMFPEWISRYVLLNFNRHAAHHYFPNMPLYHLHRVDYSSPLTISAWRWLIKAKRMPGEVLLFSNSRETGIQL